MQANNLPPRSGVVLVQSGNSFNMFLTNFSWNPIAFVKRFWKNFTREMSETGIFIFFFLFRILQAVCYFLLPIVFLITSMAPFLEASSSYLHSLIIQSHIPVNRWQHIIFHILTPRIRDSCSSSPLRGSHGLSARREQRTKSSRSEGSKAGPKGRKLESGPNGPPDKNLFVAAVGMRLTSCNTLYITLSKPASMPQPMRPMTKCLFSKCVWTQLIRLHDSFAGSYTTRCPSSSSSSSYSAPSLKSRHMYGLPSFALSGSSPIFLRLARSPSLSSSSPSSPSSTCCCYSGLSDNIPAEWARGGKVRWESTNAFKNSLRFFP